MHQRTIRGRVECAGVGLHSGQPATLRIQPAAANSGIRFVRRDLGARAIPARHAFLSDTRYATCLARGGREIRTVEHLLGAAYGLGIDNLTVELDGPEVPILDGSAAPFVRLLSQAGIVSQGSERRYLVVRRPIEVRDGASHIQVSPARGLRVSYAIDFQHPMIPYQEISMAMSPGRFLREIAPARTFCRLEEVERLRAAGLVRGGSLENAVVVSRNGYLNGGLRFPNEFVRHKILDLLGDLSLAGHRLLGHIVAYRAGHGLHARFVGALLAARDAWEICTLPAPDPAVAQTTPLQVAVAAGSAS